MITEVIAGGYCIGCGVCAVPESSPIRIRLNADGCYEAYVSPDEGSLSPSQLKELSAVCPFADGAVDEDKIAEEIFGALPHHDAAVGRFESCFAGHVAEGRFREEGSSGGLGSWIVSELLARNLVDRVLHVRSLAGDENGMLFGFQISQTPEEVRAGAKSKYYPVEMSEVLRQVGQNPGRYAVVGVPCFIKAARLLCRTDPVMRERLAFFVGLVCGHLKSRRFSELLAWQMGIEPSRLKGFDFRVKLPGARASQYGVAAWDAGGVESARSAPTHSLYGTNWGHGAFKYRACDFCDDVLAETADIVIGDAWLPKYSHDPRGTNILIIRRKELHAVIREAVEQGRLELEELSAAQISASQDAGLRHRRQGLPHRLAQARRAGNWVPRKRKFEATAPIPRAEKKRYDLREHIRDESHRAFRAAMAARELHVFMKIMRPLTEKLDRMRSKQSFPRRMISAFRRVFRL